MNQDGLSDSFIQRVSISLLQMIVRGYEPAPTSSLPATLRSISPSGSTAMRDAIVQGTSLMIDLFKVINDQSMAQNWNFVHVILTDGSDNASKVNIEQTKAVLKLIHDQLRGLNLKIIFIGVGVDSSTSYILKQLAAAAGGNGSYYDINQGQIQKIFAKITVELGLQYRRDVIGIQHQEGTLFMQRDQIKKQITVTQHNYAILFNLDISGSMSGYKWTSVCNSVQKFASNLSNVDFIAGIVFNDSARLLVNQRLINQLKNQSQPRNNNRAYQKPITNTTSNNSNNSYQNLNSNNPSPEQVARARKTLLKCCCCCCFVIILAVVLGVVLGLKA